MIKENNIHDKSYKDLFSNKDVFIKLIKNYVSDTWGNQIKSENLSLMDKSFILQDYEKIESDIVYKASIESQDVIFYVLLEFQSSVDHSMPIRLFFYMSSIWRELVKNTDKNEFKRKNFKLPAIIPIVLYNGKDTWTPTKIFKDKISKADMFENNIINFEYILLDVNRYNKEELISKGDISSAIFLLDQDNSVEELLYKIRDIALYFDGLNDKDKNLIKHWLRNTVDNKIIDDLESLLNVDKSEVEDMTSNVAKCIDEYFNNALEQGVIKEKIETVKKMLNKKYEIEDISEITGLSNEEILKIKSSIQ